MEKAFFGSLRGKGSKFPTPLILLPFPLPRSSFLFFPILLFSCATAFHFLTGRSLQSPWKLLFPDRSLKSDHQAALASFHSKQSIKCLHPRHHRMLKGDNCYGKQQNRVTAIKWRAANSTSVDRVRSLFERGLSGQRCEGREAVSYVSVPEESTPGRGDSQRYGLQVGLAREQQGSQCGCSC